MGAWGHRPFDNDTTNDWAYDLEDVDDLSVVEAAFDALEAVGPEFLDAEVACNTLGACEVLARLLGHPGYTDAYTKKVDKWVAAHKIKPPPALLKRASTAIDRILGGDSELRELWEDSDQADNWRAAIEDLRARMRV
jgi:hypothetical protein